MPLTVGPDPSDPTKFIWLDAATGEPASQPGGPGTPFIAQSDPPPAAAPGAPGAAPAARPAGSVPYSGLAAALKQKGWEPVEGSLTKAVPKMIDNPRAGLTKPDGTKEPAQIAQEAPGWQVVFKTPEGVNRLVQLAPAGGEPVAGTDPTDERYGWLITSAPADVPERATAEETNARVATAQSTSDTAKAQAEIAQSNLAKVQRDNAEMAANAAQGKGFVTNEDLRKIEKDAADQKLTADQVTLRRQEIENNNRNTSRSNEIAALNADTAAANAATAAARDLANTRYQEGQLGLDENKFEWQKAQDEITNRNAESKIKLDQLTQQQANEIAQGNLTARGAEAAETAKNNAAVLAQRTAEAATGAAATTYGNELQAQTAAGQVGGNLLSNRATAANNLLQNILSGAGGLSQGSAGRYGTLGGGLHAMPAGFSGEALMSGIQGYTGGMFGGQQTLDAAANMVRRAAPGSELTPQGQAAIGVLQQAFERYHQLGGAPHPAVANTVAAATMATNGGATAPVTTAAATPAAAAPFAGQDIQALMRQQMQQHVNPQAGFQAPTTAGAAPTIVINA